MQKELLKSIWLRMSSILLIKDFDRIVEWPLEYPLRARFLPSSAKFEGNLQTYMDWCKRLCDMAYKEHPEDGLGYDLSGIHVNPIHVEWLKWRIFYTHWFFMLPLSDGSVPENMVVVENKPFVPLREFERVEWADHIPQPYLGQYCEGLGREYYRER